MLSNIKTYEDVPRFYHLEHAPGLLPGNMI